MGHSKRKKSDKNEKGASIRSDTIETLMSIDSEELRPIYRLEGRDRYYFLLNIAKDRKINGLTPAEIEYILKKRLMIKGIHRSNIRRDLRNSKELVERSPLGRGYAYKITKAGEEHLQSILKKMTV